LNAYKTTYLFEAKYLFEQSCGMYKKTKCLLGAKYVNAYKNNIFVLSNVLV